VPLIDPLLETLPLFPVDELFPLAMPLLDPLVLDNVVPFDKTLFVLSTIGVITELGVGIADVDGAFVVFKVVLIDVGWFVVGVVVGCFVGVVGFVVVDVVVGVVIFVVVAGEVVPTIAEIYYMYLYILYVRCA
jgi:hypothetical protein